MRTLSLMLLAGTGAGLALATSEPAPRTTLSDPNLPYTVPSAPYVVLRRGPLEAVIVGNRAVDDAVLPGHRAGYHGVASLKHAAEARNLFVPAYAGLNFEHILDGTAQPREALFEPRQAPMELRAIDEYTAELYQPPTPHWGLESCARYALLDHGVLELTFECIPRRATFAHDYLHLFWASYIDRPESLDIHFLGHTEGEAPDRPPAWVRGVTPRHGDQATHRATDDTRAFPHVEPYPLELPFGFSRHRFAEPWYFGLCRGLAFVQAFRPADRVRFAQSPSGGGAGCPAWDFQWFIAQPEVGRRYQLVMRTAYLPVSANPPEGAAVGAQLRPILEQRGLLDFAAPPAPRSLPASPLAPSAPRTTHAATAPPPSPAELVFIDTGFENASPLWYEVAGDGTIALHLNYDHERASPNRAAGHIHFRVEARPGARFTFEFKHLDNIYNGRPGSVARELHAVVISTDGRVWRSVPTRVTPDHRVFLDLEMPGPSLFVARAEPYRLSDLDALLASLQADPRVELTPLGRTAEGRPLELLRVGDASAPHRVFVRARAHPWEPAGNWVVQGLLRRLLQDDADARRYRARYRVAILPLANKDGVARGRTRFNVRGKDLNRDWDRPADPELAPENAALERWLEDETRRGQRPDLALELHNDGHGAVHLNLPPPADRARYFERMRTLETLLRRHTWFSEGTTTNAPGATTLAAGWQARYGIDAVVHEFNCQSIARLGEPPLGRHWEQYGAALARVLDEYFAALAP